MTNRFGENLGCMKGLSIRGTKPRFFGLLYHESSLSIREPYTASGGHN